MVKVVGRVIKMTFPLGTGVCVKSVNKSPDTFALRLCSVSYQTYVTEVLV